MQTSNAENANTEARMNLVPGTYIIQHIAKMLPSVKIHGILKHIFTIFHE